jgi:hypothetical protein
MMKEANEIFLNFSDEQKLVYLLNPASVRHDKSYWLLFETVIRTEDSFSFCFCHMIASFIILEIMHFIFNDSTIFA